MRYQQKRFSVGYVPAPPPEPPCPLCGTAEPDNHARLWKLCKRHKQELLGERDG